MNEYLDSVFDPAFQIDCMSSEESDKELTWPNSKVVDPLAPTTKFFVRHHPAWRSQRLHALYNALDDKEEQDLEQGSSMSIRGGRERMERRSGMAKVGDGPPPKGTKRWMVSKRWLRGALAEGLMGEDGVESDPEGAEEALARLGEESEDE